MSDKENRTHRLRYNMARGGAIHRMNRRQFYSGGISNQQLINTVQGINCSANSNSIHCDNHFRNQGMERGSDGVWRVPDPRNKPWHHNIFAGPQF